MYIRTILYVAVFSACIVTGTERIHADENVSKGAVYTRIRSYCDSIRVINTHEHQQRLTKLTKSGGKPNFYSIVSSSYFRSDIVSAGAPELEYDVVSAGNLDKLWNTYGTYLDFTRNTSYYSQLLRGFRILYAFNEPYFTKESVKSLSNRISNNYSDYDRWFAVAFKKAGFSTMLIDQFWHPFNVDVYARYFTLVFHNNFHGAYPWTGEMRRLERCFRTCISTSSGFRRFHARPLSGVWTRCSTVCPTINSSGDETARA